MTRRIGLVAVAGVLAIAGCGGGGSSSNSSSSGSSSSASSSGGGQTLQLAADPSGGLKFTTSKLTAKSGAVTIDFTNKSSVPHAVAVTGNGVNKSGQIITGGKTTLSVNLKPGTYTFYCPVDGHRAAGMHGTLVVK
jgi:plastocyanin